MSLAAAAEQKVWITETFHAPDGNTVAELGVVDGSFGVQIAILSEVEGFRAYLKSLEISGGNEYNYLNHLRYIGGEATFLAKHSRHADFARHIGIGVTQHVTRNQAIQVITMPANAAYINAALDDIPDHEGFRFYDVLEDYVDGETFIVNLGEGKVPLGRFGFSYRYGHDLFSHGFGYMGQSNRRVEKTKRQAKAIVASGIEKDADGKLLAGSPAALFAAKVDTRSTDLNLYHKLAYGHRKEALIVYFGLPQFRKFEALAA